MKTKVKVQPAPKKSHRTVEVELHHPSAKEVLLAGSFNRWKPRATPMQSVGNGWWKIELSLERGRYEYRYVIDGRWVSDPRAPEQVPNPHGSFNSVLALHED